MLAKFRGRLWIDQQEFRWVKVQAEIISPLRIGLFLAKIDKGSQITFEQTRINDEVWVPSHSTIQFDARLALVKRLRQEVVVDWKEYKKFSTDSRVIGAEELPPASGQTPKPL